MANILFYTCFNARSRDTESIMFALKKIGHTIFFITQAKGKQIFSVLQDNGIESYSYEVSTKNFIFRTLKHVLYLVKFCYRKKIDIVFSHLEPSNFIAVASRYFCPSEIWIVRHHMDMARLHKFDKSITYRFIYRFAKHIIVVSQSTKQYMIDHEKINSKRIAVINLGYDFTLYDNPNYSAVEKIKSQCKTGIVLITIGRLTTFKRLDLSIALLETLLKKGVSVSLIILGGGDLLDTLKEKVTAAHLVDKVFFPGHVNNVIDYVAASDFVVHPSASESSCVVIKEAGLIKKPVIVCRGVGDFDDYIEQYKNGFLVDHDHFVEQATDIILETYKNRTLLENVGDQLNKDVVRLFSIENALPKYEEIIERHFGSK